MTVAYRCPAIKIPIAEIDQDGKFRMSLEWYRYFRADFDATGQGKGILLSSALTSGLIFVGNSLGIATGVAVTGDISINNAGVVTIAANAVTNAKLAQMAANSLKGNNTGSAATAADLTVVQALALLGLAQASPIANSLSGNVALNNASNYFDGPSVAQGSTGTWFASGTVTIQAITNPSSFEFKLWDGTTVAASAHHSITVAGAAAVVSLSGFLATPAGNLRISVKSSDTNALMNFNLSGNSKDSTITAYRLS